MTDLLIIGAGPIGLACAIEAKRVGLSARLIEKGALVNSLTRYPTQMEFFSTPDLLEIGGHPIATNRYKPQREEMIDYYRGVAEREALDARLYERVLDVEGEARDFTVRTSKGAHRAQNVVVATGFFDQSNRLGVPGEELEKVAHYYREPYAYTGQRVLVIGAKNSAAKAALQCNRHGAKVTLVHRGDEVSESVKYWIRPDLKNRIAEGSIAAYFNTTVREIREESVLLDTPDGSLELDNDFVLALIGYHPDFSLLSTLGIKTEGDADVPVYDEDTMETNRPGVFIAGTVCGGRDTSRWFIENGRVHAKRIAAHLAGRPAPEVEVKGQP